MSFDEAPCPGAGRCHNASLCASCEVTQHGPCDVRACGERCDSHPSAALVEPLLAEAEHEALCADEDAGRAEHEARKAEAIAAKLRGIAKARWATLAARKEEVGDLTRALNAARVDDATRFVAHLERASAVVKTWPLWKQQVLGGTS